MKCCVNQNELLLIQSDWNEAILEPNSRIWISSKKIGKNGIHGYLTTENFKFVNSTNNPFEVIHNSNNYMKVLHKDSNTFCEFIAPKNIFSSIHNKNILSLDVTNGGIGVSVCSENKLRVWQTSNGLSRRELKGHLMEPYVCRFFPSGEVILTGGVDMQLKIWSAFTGRCAATLYGHRASILDVAIVDRGRNIISVSKDGSAKLWDCGQAKCIENIVELPNKDNINTCSLQTCNQYMDLGSRDKPIHELAFGTLNKILIIGCETGFVYGYGLNSNKKLFEIENNTSVNACHFISEFNFIFGTQSGEIQLYDIRSPNKFVKSWEDSASPVLSLLPYKYSKNEGYFVGRSDGTCLYHYIEKDEVIQFTGSNFEPINKIATDGQHLYTACRDGNIRKYELKN